MTQLGRYLELGTHTVRAGDEDRPVCTIQLEKASKTRSTVDDLRPVGTGRQSSDAVLEIFHLREVDAGLPVAPPVLSALNSTS